MKRTAIVAIASMVYALTAPMAEGAVIYSESYSGNGAPLHGKTPTVDNYNGGGNSWITRTQDGTPTGTGTIFYDDGTVFGPDTLNYGAAMLPFVPQPGLIYSLDVSIGRVMTALESNNWFGFGFALGTATGTGNSARFVGPGGTEGQGWMLRRGSGDGGNGTPLDAEQTFAGPGTGGVADWPVTFGDKGDPIDMRITLDTREAAWVAEWFAKNPTDADYTLLRSHTYGANPSIGAVGYANAALDVITDVGSFQLTVVPEPTTIMLVGMLAIGIVCLRRAF